MDFGVDQSQLVADSMLSKGLAMFEMDLTLEPLVMTVAKMESKMQHYRETLKPSDTFVMYTHSHGYLLGLGAGWGENPEDIYYAWDKLADAILALPAKNVVIFTMSCHSGSLADAIKAKEVTWKDQWKAKGRNLIILTAVANDQIASATTNGSTWGEIGNPFTFAVRTAPSGEADYSKFGNQDGTTSYGEMVDYVLDIAKAYSVDQLSRPQFAGEFDREAIFSRASAQLTTVQVPDGSLEAKNPPIKYNLIVKGGYGSGSYAAGQEIFIQSAASTQNQVHVRWSGDTIYLEQSKEWFTKLVMPANDVSVESITVAKNLVLSTRTFKGATQLDKTMRYSFPSNMRGVVLFNHGAGGSSSFIEKPEAFALALGFVNAGYGVIAVDAEEVVAGDVDGDQYIGWDHRIVADNSDLKNLQILFAGLVNQGVLSETIPKFALGMSNGGAFSHALGTITATALVSQFPQLKFKAVAAYCSDATYTNSGKISLTPSAWYLCGGENNSGVSNGEAIVNYSEMQKRGIKSFIGRSDITPLYRERFLRIPDITLEQSLGISDELKASGFVDSIGYLTANSKTIADYILDPANRQKFPMFQGLGESKTKMDVIDQIQVMLGEHSMHSYFIQRNIAFFAAQP